MTNIKKLMNADNIGKGLVILSVFSFFCSDLSLNVGFTLKPFHFVAALSLVFLIVTRKSNKSGDHFSKVDKAFLVFFLASLISALLSPFSAIASLKHMCGITVLAGSFYIFKRLYCRYEPKEIVKLVSSAGLAIIAVTIVWYIAGLIALGFNFNIKDTFCYGVRVDRKIPRLISFAYNEPNYVSIYFAILFAFYVSAKRNLKNIIGLVGSLAIIILTLSRGGYIAFAATLLAYYVFAKISLKNKAKDMAIMVVAGALSFACATAIINAKPSEDIKPTPATTNQSTQQNTANATSENKPQNTGNNTAIQNNTNSNANTTQNTGSSSVAQDGNKKLSESAISIMARRFSTSVSDSGSGRIVHWKNAVTTFKNNPITGIGPGNILDYNKSTYGKLAPSHNSFLDTLAEQGIIGAAAYLLLIAAIVVSCWKLRGYTIMPAMGFIFLFASELFLSLSVTDMLFINILALDVAETFWRREKNRTIIEGERKNPKKTKNNSNKKYKLSFVVPVYNVGPYLEQCLDSLVNQTRNDFEIIIVDDGSTDNSPDICKKYANFYSRIHYFRTKNHGLAAARNFGVKKAIGDYLWFIDSDDFITKDAFDRVYSFLSHDIVTIKYFNYYNDDDMTEGNDSNANNPVSRYLLNPGFAPFKIVKRSLFLKESVSFPEGKNYEDVSTMFPLVAKTHDIVHSNEAVYFYRRRGKSISSTQSKKNIDDHLWATKQLLEIRDDKYVQELQYQAIIQYLFIAFELKNDHNSNTIMNKLKDEISQVIPNITDNKYLSSGAKNKFYKLYVRNLLGEKWKKCLFMNKTRNIIITWKRICR